MILAADAASGADKIVVQKGEFVLRGAYIRIGSQIRDLCEERVVVQASNDQTPGLTTLKLGIPLRFFHPAKELVATVLLSSTELAKRLDISDTQTLIREILNEIIADTLEKASIIYPEVGTASSVNTRATLVTSFEPMTTAPIASPNLRVGPMMRYFSSWSGSEVSVFTDRLSDRKLVAYWEGLELEGGNSNQTVSTEDLKRIIRRNAYLSLLLSTAQEHFDTKSDEIQLSFQDFRTIFRLPPLVLQIDEENEIRLQLPLSYLRRHFQVLAQSSTSCSSGFKAVSAAELIRRVRKDIIDHPPVISDDPTENQTALDQTRNVCQHLEREFTTRQAAPVSWPELIYFVRYNNRLVTPEIFPSQSPLVLGSKDREVAEVVAGKHSTRLLILFYDGSVDIWDIASSATLESQAQVLFSSKEGPSETKSFMEPWMDANQTSSNSLAAVQRSSKRIRQFKRSRLDSLVRFCAWDSVVCVNSSILEEKGSGSFRFFRLARNFVSPLRQVTVDKVTLTGGSSKKKGGASSSGIINCFQVTVDGTQIVFLSESETILWISCAVTGEIMSHVDLKVTQAGKFQALFHISETVLLSGEIETQLYATTLAKSYRHVGMWVLPQKSTSIERKRVFSFGKAKITTVVDLSITGNLLFVASKDGSIAVWSTITDETSPISPLVCLRIPRSEELQSIWCQSLRRTRRKPKIRVWDKEIDQWEAEVLLHFDPPPLRFALYLFEDGEVIRLAISDRFDVRLVTLNDSEFAYDTFLAPVSGVKQNPARRVALQHEQVIRVVFIALQHAQDGIFAQKSVQGFFTDVNIHDILWKCHDDMVKFALSYQENVIIQLKPFYRDGDGEQIELTPPHQLNSDGKGTKLQETLPEVVVGAVLRARDGNQKQFQTWKFVMNWIADDIHNDLVSGQIEYARQSLALQSSYRLEAERIFRFRDDFSHENHMKKQDNRRISLVRCMQDNVRDIIAQPDEATDRFLRTVSIYLLESFVPQRGLHPLEQFVSFLFNQASFSVPNDTVSRVEVSSITEFLRQAEANSHFAAWVTKVVQEMEKCDWKKGVTWDSLALIVSQIQASTISSADLGSLLVDLGLANAFFSQGTESEYPSSSLPNFVHQLHQFLSSRRPEPLTLEATMNVLHSPQSVVEFVVDCTNFSSFFRAKMADLSRCVTEFIDAGSAQKTPEISYAIQLKMITWQRGLYDIARSQNEFFSQTSKDENANALEPTVKDLQQLRRFLTTPLPCVSPHLSSITLENRCDTIHCRNRFVMNAMGRLEADFHPLSVVYVFMDGGQEEESAFQQELTFLGKLKHLRAREFFLPVLDVLNVPILSDAKGLMANGSDTGEIHCIVAESLKGWSSLAKCLEFMQLSDFSIAYWMKLLWFWSIRVLLMLLTMQNEKFQLREGVDLNWLLIAANGSELRLCSLSSGSFVRFEDTEDAYSLSRATAKVFGCFVYELLRKVASNRGSESDEVISVIPDDNMLCQMRRQLLHWISTMGNNKNERNLSDFASVSQITVRGPVIREGDELDRLCELALLGLQPESSRPGLTSLWVYAGRPGMAVLSEMTAEQQTLSKQLMTLVGTQRLIQKLRKDLRLCWELCDDEERSTTKLREIIESWVDFLKRILDSRENTTTTRIFAASLSEILDNDVPSQLCGLSMRLFTHCSRRGDRDQGRNAVVVLLKGYTNVLELVVENTSFNSFKCDSLLMKMVLQILNGLMSFASGHMPLNDECYTVSRFHRDATTNAVLWRLSEPLFRNLLGIEMQSSNFPVLLRWLDSRQPPFGFNPTPWVDYNGGDQEITLWWDDSAPQIPHLTPSSAAEDALLQSECAGSSSMTANYLRCVYETKEIEFKLTSGVSVAKFRLAALQQLFGPVFMECKSCYPLVFVQPVVATVWNNLNFERLICTLLRDGDEKMVLGALSLLDCCTCVFRFNPHCSPRDDKAPAFSCPERTFGFKMCGQSVVIEVKRVLDKTIKALKVLGESGVSSASRSQHPLVAILCVGLAWLVNCLHGGDGATQFWGLAGLDKLIIAHCKANALPFLKVRDSNMINQAFHKNQRMVQGPETTNKWRVFTSEMAQTTSHRSTISPFRLMLEEIVWIGSSRTVDLMRTLLFSRSFREETSATYGRGLAFQLGLISSGDYGKVSHAIDLARDITQLNGTISERVQVILYAKALFLYHTTSARVRVSTFVPVFKDIWGWVEAAWQTVASTTKLSNGKGVKLLQNQGDVIVAGFSLLHSIISHPALSVEDIVELTTFLSMDNDERRNILQELVNWIVNFPIEASQHRSAVPVLVENGVTVVINSVHSRSYDDVALAMMDTCIGIQVVLELLEKQYSLEAKAGIVGIGEKQQLWSMLLYFDSRVVTSRILDLDFLDTAVFSRLLSLNANNQSTEALIDSLNQRLEAVMYLEVLVFAASRRGKSVNTLMLFGETCKLLLHHDIIAKEATYVLKAKDFSCLSQKHAAVCKRVMQLVCCLSIDFSTQSTSRAFVAKLKSVGIPEWVLAFHQAQQTEHEIASSDQLLTRVDLFWKDWQGRAAVENLTRKSEKTLVQAVPRRQRSVFEKVANHRIQVKPSEFQLDSDEDLSVTKAKKPKVSTSALDTARNPPNLSQKASRARATSKMNASVIQTFLSIDAESALHLAKQKKHGQQQPKDEIEEGVLDSDAYSALTGGSSEEEIKQKRRRAPHKSRTRLKSGGEKKLGQAKQLESKTEQNNTRSHESRSSNSDSENSLSATSRRDRAHSKAKSSHKAPSKRSKVAEPPRNQQNEALLGVFRKYDVDGDGVISFIDLRRAMDRQTKGHRLSDVEIQRWITEKDKGGQGVVSFEDFVVAFQGQLQHT